MKTNPAVAAVAVISFASLSSPALATFHLWNINELYSNADGTVQYIELFTAFNTQEFTVGQTIRATQGISNIDFVFPSNTPAPTGGHHLLLATAGFASVSGAVTPDFTLPDGFLFTPNGLVNFIGANSLTYDCLPIDGVLSLHCDANNTVSCTAISIGPNSPTNYAGAVGSIDAGTGGCLDGDNDGFGSPGNGACSGGATPDCDDCNGNVFPGNVETTCDGLDNDCDPGTLDEPDADLDGASACIDCDDGNSDVFPGNIETTCDGIDNDCDPGTLDEPDADLDGVSVCLDCDDGNSAVFPGNTETCGDGLDNDCNGQTDCSDPFCETADPLCSAPAIPIHLVLVADELAAPLGVTHAGDGSGNLFVVDQSGLIRVIDAGGNLLPTPFLDVTDRMISIGIDFGGGFVFDERGLLGLAFHPDYFNNGLFYVVYSAPRTSTGSEPCDLFAPDPNCHMQVVSEFSVLCANPVGCQTADPASERIILTVDEPQFNHNAGDIAFGPDGFLYVPLGDGGGANDGLADSPPSHGPTGHGQNIETLLGSILRVDISGDDFPADPDRNYAIPVDNPFVGVTGADEIYAYGFRNPFRISFDDGPGGDGRLYVGDVGQDLFEEVDLVEKGGNYGWVIREGAHCFDPLNPGTPPASCATTGALGEPLLDPVSDYSHDEGGLSVIGGHVYRGSGYPALQGRYVYGDFSANFGPSGRLYYFDTTGPNAFFRQEFFITPNGDPLGLMVKGFGEDQDGEMYVSASTDLAPSGTSGQVFRIVKPPDPVVASDSFQRSLGVVLPASSAGAETAYRLTLSSLYNPGDPQPVGARPDFAASEGEVRYLNLFRDGGGAVVTDCVSLGAFGTTYPCISVGCEPEFADWGALFGGVTAYLMGNSIIPDSAYTIAHLASSCAGNEAACSAASAEVPFTTARYGDSEPSGVVSVTDVVNTVDVVKQANPGVGPEYKVYIRQPIPVPHLEPANVTDIVLHVDALKLEPYRFPVNSCP